MTPRSMDKTASRISDELLASMINEAVNEDWEDFALALRELQSLRSLSDSVSDGSKERLATLCSEWPMWLHDAVTHATDLADKKDWSTEQVVGYAILSAIDSGTGEQQPVAWRGQHSHPKALGKWVYVDGPEKPKSLIGGLGLLEPLYSSPTEPKAGVVSEDMVERAAKRLCLATGLDWDSIDDSAPNDHSNDSGEETKGWFRYLARAALPNTTGEAE